MTAGVSADPIVGQLWRRGRIWLVVAAVLVLGAILVGVVSDAPGRPLDPDSAHQDGSKALARVLAGYGVTVSATSNLGSVPVGAPAVLVTAPDDYSDVQLQRLRAGAGLLVLVQPGARATTAVLPGVSPDPPAAVESDPGCQVEGARAAGSVEPLDDTRPYAVPASTAGSTSCYGGAVVFAPGVVLLGSAQLLQNDALDRHGVAALDVNALTADRTVRSVTWLLPGADAAGSGPVSIWDLFPGGAHRAFQWLIVLGVIVVLWRGRTLGPVVREPLPVIVRSAEVVEGLGRLYDRAGARDRAARGPAQGDDGPSERSPRPAAGRDGE